MTINPLKLIGGDGSDRLFAPHELYFQEYYKFIDGGDSSDLLYGGYGTVQLIGGLGADVFILEPPRVAPVQSNIPISLITAQLMEISSVFLVA